MENQINYTVGDDVISLETHSQKAFVKDWLTVCKGIKTKDCGCEGYIVNVGIKSPHEEGKAFCRNCRKPLSSDGWWWFKAKSFTKLDSISISEAYEVLQKEPYQL